jgi:hypothetical protein
MIAVSGRIAQSHYAIPPELGIFPVIGWPIEGRCQPRISTRAGFGRFTAIWPPLLIPPA